MDIGLIGGFAVAYVLREGCAQTCELDMYGYILLCVIVLIAALGALYVIKHSGGGAAAPKIPPPSAKEIN